MAKKKSMDSQVSELVQSSLAERVLTRLFQSRSPLTISFHRDSELYNSILLEVDTKNDILLLDRFAPSTGHKKAIQGESFNVLASDRGVQVTFTGFVKKYSADIDEAMYEVPFPSDMRYHQKRSEYRAPIHKNEPLLFSYELDTGDKTYQFHANLLDLSYHGMCFSVPQDDILEFRGTDILGKASICILGQKVNIQCKICHCYYDSLHDYTVVGANFVRLDPFTDKYINQMVIKLQQEQAQHNARSA